MRRVPDALADPHVAVLTRNPRRQETVGEPSRDGASHDRERLAADSCGLVVVSQRKLIAESLVTALRLGGYATAQVAAPAARDEAPAIPRDTRLILIDLPRDLAELGAMIARYRSACPGAHIALIADSASGVVVGDAAAAGVDGFLTTTTSVDAFRDACRRIAAGVKVFPLLDASCPPDARPPASVATDDDPDADAAERLSEREGEVLATLTEGLSNKEIARRFGITESTVKTHLKGVLRKIGVSNRTQAAIWAHARGFGRDDRTADKAGSEAQS